MTERMRHLDRLLMHHTATISMTKLANIKTCNAIASMKCEVILTTPKRLSLYERSLCVRQFDDVVRLVLSLVPSVLFSEPAAFGNKLQGLVLISHEVRAAMARDDNRPAGVAHPRGLIVIPTLHQ